MKMHPLQKITAVLLELHSLAACACVVYFSVFNVILAEDHDPNINIWLLCFFVLMAMIAVMLEVVVGKNTQNQDSLVNLQALALAAAVCNGCAWFSGAACGQVWLPFPIGVVLCIVYLYGLKKTVEE